MLMVETEGRVSDLRGDRYVLEYVAELLRFWPDLDHYDPLALSHASSKDAKTIYKGMSTIHQ